MKYPDKTALVIVNPLFTEFAVRMARDFGKVYLFTPWVTTFPKIQAGMIGYGMEGIERVDDVFGDHFEEVDIFIFGDIYRSSMQVYLESIGKRVWGPRNGEELEIYREVCKEVMQEKGLPVQPYKVIKGIKSLREYLASKPRSFVKIDKWRGNFETFFSESIELVEPKLCEIEGQLGGFKDIVEFCVEDELPDCVEVGLDCYCIDGKFPSSTLCGIEVKDLGYVAEFLPYKKINEPITRWTTSMAPELAKYGYRGFISNEIRIGKDLEPYMIDACCRLGCPPNEVYQEFYLNLAEIVWEGAGGRLVDPEPAGKFAVELILKSDWAKTNWQPIGFDPKFRNQIKIFNPVCVNGQYFAVPQDEDMAEIGAVVGWGDTLDDAIAHAMKAADSIKGYGIKIPKGSIDDAKKQMEELEEFGVSPFSVDLKKTKD